MKKFAKRKEIVIRINEKEDSISVEIMQNGQTYACSPTYVHDRGDDTWTCLAFDRGTHLTEKQVSNILNGFCYNRMSIEDMIDAAITKIVED